MTLHYGVIAAGEKIRTNASRLSAFHVKSIIVKSA